MDHLDLLFPAPFHAAAKHDVFPPSPDPDDDHDDEPPASLTSQSLNPDGTPKRPMNAFMIFARRRRPQVSAENQAMRTGEISKILSREWSAMEPADKQFYLDQAKTLKQNFNSKYPDYVYRRRPNNSRKRRRTDPPAAPRAADAQTPEADDALEASPVDADEPPHEHEPPAEYPFAPPDPPYADPPFAARFTYTPGDLELAYTSLPPHPDSGFLSAASASSSQRPQHQPQQHQHPPPPQNMHYSYPADPPAPAAAPLPAPGTYTWPAPRRRPEWEAAAPAAPAPPASAPPRQRAHTQNSYPAPPAQPPWPAPASAPPQSDFFPTLTAPFFPAQGQGHAQGHAPHQQQRSPHQQQQHTYAPPQYVHAPPARPASALAPRAYTQAHAPPAFGGGGGLGGGAGGVGGLGGVGMGMGYWPRERLGTP